MQREARPARSCAAPGTDPLAGSQPDAKPIDAPRSARTCVPDAAAIPAEVGAFVPLEGGVSLPATPTPRLFDASLALDTEPEPDEAQAPARPARWRALLAGNSPSEILARIVPEDPLGVRTIVAVRLRQQALLLDADRVHLRSLALCARWAPRYQGQPEFQTWLARLVDQAASELLREEQEDFAHEGVAPTSALAALAEPLGLDARVMQLCCRSFNRLPEDERRAFFELVLRARSLDELAHASGTPAVDIARRARRALNLFTPPVVGPAARKAHAARRGSEERR
ncbi:MAG: sigma-70 family RNA polymerase sigma factor [Planctomycetes bacterium]|nr:sigma-70 family RNA polymerase sigma factor [Planctomycetota bacterium]